MSTKFKGNLDETDLFIIKRLCEDSNTSLASIGDELNVSPSTIHKRICRLKEGGIIERFTILFDPSILNLKTIAFIGIELERSALVGKKKDEVISKLLSMQEVLEIHETLEPFDLLLKLRTENVDFLREIIGDISTIEGVHTTNTILTTKKILETPLKYETIKDLGDIRRG
ncbi:Lrp/AsnC family transcriptional regulator [Methanocella sp. CWC-04]|uniref:Lrp/AsnC family transcriptional regulator n=1 Tax=Methanooceanicella nereidis TaxID=2052831 RepID=A0AAP2W5X6_9EURY|nr:Lrp/AsnC family transcriptional regulator [Methanocella sp. CWC-04]MCD1296055.1 Lrp/AsnC family transcriptional regulator [Methanocella sp. CWC-04]